MRQIERKGLKASLFLHVGQKGPFIVFICIRYVALFSRKIIVEDKVEI